MKNVVQRFYRIVTRVTVGMLSVVMLASLINVGIAHAYLHSYLTGTVTDQNGNGLGGVEVFIQASDPMPYGPPSVTVYTAADGTYGTYAAAGQLYQIGDDWLTNYDLTFTPLAGIDSPPIVVTNYPASVSSGLPAIINQRFVAQALPAPQDLAVSSPAREPMLSWSAVNGAASYNIYRDGIVIGQSAATHFSDPAAAEGDHAYAVSAVGAANNESPRSGDVHAVVDRTAPVLGIPIWTTNPAPLGSSSTLSVPASDAFSGVTVGEYFIGNDPGVGNGTPMSYDAGSLSAAVGSTAGVGVHDIAIRAKDAAGNWSLTTPTMLVVYDPTTALGVTGKNKKDLIPSLAAGDHLPGLITNTQTDAAEYGLTVQYKNGILDPANDFHFTYSNCGNKPTGPDCHTFALDATSFLWLVIDQTNNSRARFQGIGTVTVDGTTSTNPFTVQAVDGDRLSPVDNDTLILKVFAPDANPDSATPIYQASGSMSKGTSVRIR